MGSQPTEWLAGELAGKIDCRLIGDADLAIKGCAVLEEAGAGQISFVANTKYASHLKKTKASAVVVSEEHVALAQEAGIAAVFVPADDDPYFAFRQAMVLIDGFREQPAPGVHAMAVVHPEAKLGEDVSVGPFAVVEAGATVGDRTVLYSNTFVGKDATIGEDCLLYPGVAIYEDCVLGDRVTLHANTTIGQDGFGYATHLPTNDESSMAGPIHHKIPTSGNAVIEDDVEMGANCSVDRATMGSTVIGKGTKFSNAVTIGHGAKIGEHNLYVAQVGIAGSTTTGSYVVMGGQVGVAGHLNIGDGVRFGAKSGVMRDVEPGDTQIGQPAQHHADFKRQAVALTRLPRLSMQFKAMKRQIKELERKLENLERR